MAGRHQAAVGERSGVQALLASLGLVETRQGGGTFVRPYSGEVLLSPLLPMLALQRTDILHVLEYRQIVERGCVALAVRRAGPAEVAELERACSAMRGSTGDLGAFARADLEFHLALARASKNPVLVKVNSVIRDILSASMEEMVRGLGTRDGLYHHHRILRALQARDAAKAVALMEEHVNRTIDRLKEQWSGSCPETAAVRLRRVAAGRSVGRARGQRRGSISASPLR